MTHNHRIDRWAVALITAAALACMLAMTSCGGVAEARAALDAARNRVAQIEQALKASEHALAIARTIADRTGSEQAIAAVATAERAAEALRSAMPGVQSAAEAAEAALVAAEQATASRWGWLEVAGTVALSLIGGGGAAIMQAYRAKRWADLAAHGIQLAQTIKKRAESASVPVADILTTAATWQHGRGVHDDVEAIRHGKTHL